MPHLPLRAVAARLTAALAAAALGLLVLPAPAVLADDAADAPVRWSVTPSDANGPDGRRFAEYQLDPGASADDHLAIRNSSDHEVSFALAAADGYFTRSGRFDTLSSDKKSVDSGTWISLPPSVTVAAGATVVVPYSISVPERAEPGDHAAGITASITSTQTADGGASVGVESRIGFRVLTRVNGQLAPAAALANGSASYEMSWNPFRPGSVTVSFDVQNTGNARILVAGTVEAGGQSISFPAEGESAPELLPGDHRTLSVSVPGAWPLFSVPVAVTLQPTAVTFDGQRPEVAPASWTSSVIAVPWPQIAVLVGLALVVWALVGSRRRSRRRLTAMLDRAREEGRRTAEQETSS